MEKTTEGIYLTIILGALSVLIVLSNAVIVTLVCFNKTLRTYTNWLILSLAVSDLLTGSLLFSMTLFKPSYVVEGYFTAMILLSGVINISAVTCDRFIAIVKPLEYSYLVPKFFKRGIAIIWLVSAIYASVPLIWGADHSKTAHRVYLACLELLGVVVPYIFITAAYIRIFRQVRRSLALRKNLKSVSRQINERRRISADAKVAKIYCIVSLAFLFSWLPILYMTTAFIVKRIQVVPDILSSVSFFTIAAGSLANPLLYAFLKPDFKMALRNLYQKCSSRCVEQQSISVRSFKAEQSKNKTIRWLALKQKASLN